MNPDQVYEHWVKRGDEMADRKSAYKLLDDSTRSVLAQETQRIRILEDCSMAQAESMARCSQAYKDHLIAVSDAHKAYLQAQIRYDGMEVWVNLKRTEAATERATAGMTK